MCNIKLSYFNEEKMKVVNNSVNSSALKTKQKEIKQAYLEEINERTFVARKSNNGRILHNFVRDVVNESSCVFPWVA